MHPEFLKIGNLTVYSYGVMVALAFIVSLGFASFDSKKFGINPTKITDLWILFLFSGIIGARLFYVASNLDYFFANPLEIVMIYHGGLVFYGGFILAALSGIVFGKINNMPFWKTGDFLAPYFALGHSIGRLGCFFNGCCYGKPTDTFFGVHFPGVPGDVWPTQIIESAALFLIFIVLYVLRKIKHFDGFILLGYFILYSIVRFFIEFLRGDNPEIISRLTSAQLISVAVFFAAFFIMIRKFKNWKNILSR